MSSTFYGAECFVRASVPWIPPTRVLRAGELLSAASFLERSGRAELLKTRLVWTGTVMMTAQWQPQPIPTLIGLFSSSAVEMAYYTLNNLHRLRHDDARFHSDDVHVHLGRIVRSSFTHLPSWYYDDPELARI